MRAKLSALFFAGGVGLSLLAPSETLCAQERGNAVQEAAVENATAKYYRERDATRRIAFEDLTSPFGAPPEPSGRSSARVARILAILGGKAETFTNEGYCEPGGGTGCLDLLLRIGTPIVAGDSATIVVHGLSIAEGERYSLRMLFTLQHGEWLYSRNLSIDVSIMGRVPPIHPPGHGPGPGATEGAIPFPFG